MQSKIIVILLFFFELLFANALEAQRNAKNIIFISVDDLKPLLACYGHSEMQTPHFDNLAKMGTIFLNAHVQQAVCGPSRASVMTGTYPDHCKVWDLETNFRNSAPQLFSMPEYLRSNGYVTAISGKKIYHNGSVSQGHDAKSWTIPYTLPDDFDPAFHHPAGRLYHNDSLQQLASQYYAEASQNGISDMEGQDWYVFKKIMVSTEMADVSDEAYEDGLYTKHALTKLRDLSQSTSPFFLAIGYSRPHLPFNAPKKYWDFYDRKNIEVEKFQEMIPNTPEYLYHTFGELRAYHDIGNGYDLSNKIPLEKQKELIHGYMACVSYIDAQIGKILDEVVRLGIQKNTIIVLWGDHGFHLGDHAMWCKHSNFEQATRIPFMFAGCDIKKNQMISNPVELLDLFPTLFDLVGAPIPSQVDGISLKNLLLGNKNPTIKKDFALSQYPRHGGRMGYSIRTERFRYTEWHKNEYNTNQKYQDVNIEYKELYDYKKDPLETKNLAYDKKHTKTINALHNKLKSHLDHQHLKISNK